MRADRDDAVAGRSTLPIPPAPPSGVRALPMIQKGRGDRQSECVNIGECLARFVRAHRGAEGHCPRGCEAFEAVPSYARHAIVHADVSRAAGEFTLGVGGDFGDRGFVR